MAFGRPLLRTSYAQDAAILPTWTQRGLMSFGITSVCAMALGVPVISTDVVGIPELVRHNETGLCVAERDPAALADAMEQLLENTGLRQDLASRARTLIEEEFDIRKNAATQRELFRAAMTGGAGSACLPAASTGTAIRRI